MRTAGERVEVTKAGRWGFYGSVVRVHEDATCDVALDEGNITLTHKPASEVKHATLTRIEQMHKDVENAHGALTAPTYAHARSVRQSQSRVCCLTLTALGVACLVTSIQCWLTAFSLMPVEGTHPSGYCELCTWVRFQGRVCHTWPETSPRCHEHFLPWVYAGAFAFVVSILPGTLVFMSFRNSCGAMRGEATLGEDDGTTSWEYVYHLCDTLAFGRTLWCCGTAATESELRDYGDAEDALRHARNKIKMDEITSYSRGLSSML